jgi:hypothetical protein
MFVDTGTSTSNALELPSKPVQRPDPLVPGHTLRLTNLNSQRENLVLATSVLKFLNHGVIYKVTLSL